MNPIPESRNPVTAPQQHRSAQTQKRILDVVEKHLLGGTFDDITVQDLVSEAGSSVGAFYGRFANKAAAMYRFYDDRCHDLEDQVTAVLDPDRAESLAELLEIFTKTVVHRTFAYAPIIKSDSLRLATDTDSPFTLRARELNTRLLNTVRRCLDARQGEMTHRSSHETALFVLALVGGMSRDAVVSGGRLVDDPGKFNAELFARELNRAVAGYLGVTARKS